MVRRNRTAILGTVWCVFNLSRQHCELIYELLEHPDGLSAMELDKILPSYFRQGSENGANSIRATIHTLRKKFSSKIIENGKRGQRYYLADWFREQILDEVRRAYGNE